VGLAGSVIGVLAEDDDFYLIEGGGVEGVEDETAGGVDGLPAEFFCFKMGGDLEEIRLFEFLAKGFFPAIFDLYVHRWWRLDVALVWPKVNKSPHVGIGVEKGLA